MNNAVPKMTDQNRLIKLESELQHEKERNKLIYSNLREELKVIREQITICNEQLLIIDKKLSYQEGVSKTKKWFVAFALAFLATEFGWHIIKRIFGIN